jgi:hypothetical protein
LDDLVDGPPELGAGNCPIGSVNRQELNVHWALPSTDKKHGAPGHTHVVVLSARCCAQRSAPAERMWSLLQVNHHRSFAGRPGGAPPGPVIV